MRGSEGARAKVDKINRDEKAAQRVAQNEKEIEIARFDGYAKIFNRLEETLQLQIVILQWLFGR